MMFGYPYPKRNKEIPKKETVNQSTKSKKKTRKGDVKK